VYVEREKPDDDEITLDPSDPAETPHVSHQVYVEREKPDDDEIPLDPSDPAHPGFINEGSVKCMPSEVTLSLTVILQV
jgi:hypothetical protein